MHHKSRVHSSQGPLMRCTRWVQFGRRTKEASIFYHGASTGELRPLGGSRAQPSVKQREQGGKRCEITKCLLLLARRAKVFRGKKVLGDYDIKVEQVLMVFFFCNTFFFFSPQLWTRNESGLTAFEMMSRSSLWQTLPEDIRKKKIHPFKLHVNKVSRYDKIFNGFSVVEKWNTFILRWVLF